MASLLGIAILMKIFPVLLLCCFAFKKEFKPLRYTAISCCILVSLSIIFCGSEIWIFYLKNVLPKASNGEIATAFVDNYQSVFMFLKRMLVFDPIENPTAFFDSPSIFTAFVWGLKLVILLIGFFITRNVSTKLFALSYWIVAMLLLSPYGSTYTFLLLIFPYLALSKYHLPLGEKVFFAIVLLLVNNFPLAISERWSFPFSYLKLFFFGLFLLGFVALAFKKINWAQAGLVFPIPFLLLLVPFGENPAKSHYVLNDSPILIYDYQLSHQQLTYFYWNENGENHTTIPFNHAVAKPLTLKENQVYYHGKPLTSDKSNKRNPVLVDDHTILYLSDLDRGIGFYTLRKLHFH